MDMSEEEKKAEFRRHQGILTKEDIEKAKKKERETEKEYIKDDSRYIGRTRINFFSYDIIDENNKFHYRLKTGCNWCNFGSYVYFSIVPWKKQRKERGFAVRAESMTNQYLRENNLIDAIYVFFPPDASWEDRALLIASAIYIEDTVFVTSTQSNKD